jgi:hypothetical protein
VAQLNQALCDFRQIWLLAPRFPSALPSWHRFSFGTTPRTVRTRSRVRWLTCRLRSKFLSALYDYQCKKVCRRRHVSESRGSLSARKKNIMISKKKKNHDIKAAPGIEPGIVGTADPCLTTWLCHRSRLLSIVVTKSSVSFSTHDNTDKHHGGCAGARGPNCKMEHKMYIIASRKLHNNVCSQVF